MERETKVGLLAGLAVIICFSVILANRGRRDGLDAAAGSLLVDFSNRPAVVPESGTRLTLPAHAALPAHASPAPVRAADQADGLVPGGAAVPGPTQDDLLATGAFVGREGVGGYRAETDRLVAAPLDLSARPIEAAPRKTEAQVVQAETSPGPVEAASSLRRYVVSAGDTLSGIAAMHYGSRSGATIQAIFEHNRDVVDTPDNLKAGTQLVLPALPPEKGARTTATLARSDAASSEPAGKRETSGATRKSTVEGRANVPSGPTKRTSASDRPKRSPERWYEVRKGDGLQQIAREQLGDPSRWKEIHDLNREVLVAPDKLREGTRIRLPEREAGARTRRKS